MMNDALLRLYSKLWIGLMNQLEMNYDSIMKKKKQGNRDNKLSLTVDNTQVVKEYDVILFTICVLVL